MEEVECAECNTRYDSQTQPFCPRCGNARRSGDRPRMVPALADPRKRPARMAGIILLTLGAFAMVQGLYSAVVPQELADADLEALGEVDLLASQPGGDIHIQLLHNGTSVDAPVTLQGRNGDVLATGNTSNGWYNVTGLDAAFGNVTVNGSLAAWFYVPLGETVSGQVDVGGTPQWVAVRSVPATQIIAGFIAFFAAFVVFAGVAAVRLKWWKIALGGAIMALFPAIIMLLVVPLAGVFLVIPTGLALLLIVRGRSQFS